MKPILVSIASRNHPDRLEKCIEMIKKQAYSQRSFQIQVIIDDDQIEMYKFLLLMKDDLIISVSTHKKKNWNKIFNLQHEEMKKGYYFFMFFPDDLSNLSEHWDKDIVKKKGKFKDDLFVLYTKSVQWGRSLNVYKSAYKGIGHIDGVWEQTPIWTYKFGEFIYYLFKAPFKYKMGRELIIAEIIRLLEEKGHNRHVSCDMDYEVLCESNNNIEAFPQYTHLRGKDFDDLKPIIRRMEEYIEKKK